MGALKVGLVNGELVLNPTSEQRQVSDLDVTVVSTGKKVVMIEAGANEVNNDTMFRAIELAHQENQKQVELINRMVSEIGKPKFDYPHADFNQELFDKIVEATMDEAKAAMDTDDKNVREARWNVLMDHWHELFAEEYPDMDKYLDEITYKFQKKIVKAWLLQATVWTAAPKRDPSSGGRSGCAAPGSWIGSVYARPDPGAQRVYAGHAVRCAEAGYHLGRGIQALYASLQFPRLQCGRGRRPAAPAAARSVTALSPSAPWCRVAAQCGRIPLCHPCGERSAFFQRIHVPGFYLRLHAGADGCRRSHQGPCGWHFLRPDPGR